MKNALRTALSLLFTAWLLTSCSSSAPEQFIPQSTEPLFEETSALEPLRAEDIVYESDTVPTVYITTANGKQVTSKDVYSDCTFRIELNGIYAEFESTYTDENGGGAQIQCRGNTSYTRPEVKQKKLYSYKLKLDIKADLFGFGESKHWYLISNYFDVSSLRNKLAYDFSGALGLTYTQSTWVELYYNGQYRGLYLLTESLRIDEERVDTVNWDEFAEDVAKAYAKNHSLSDADTTTLVNKLQSNLSWITKGSISVSLSSGVVSIDLSQYFDPDELDFTSGYLIEYDRRLDGNRTKWSTANGVPVALKSPERLNTNTEMRNVVRDLIQDFENALYSPTFHNAKGKHYSEYVDVQSMVDYWLVWTLFDNYEFGQLSMYYYIDGGKIYFGPCWDFDLTAGNIVTKREGMLEPYSWTTDKMNAWFKEALGDPYFSALCQERWFEIRELADDLLRSLDIYHSYMGKAALRSYAKNGTRKNWYLPKINGGHSYDFQTDFQVLKTWLYNRCDWLDGQLKSPAPAIAGSDNTRSKSLKATAKLNSQELKKPTFDLYGVQCDYVLSPSSDGKLDITLKVMEANAASCAFYLNGTKLIAQTPIKLGETAEFSLHISELDMTEGAINVLYFPIFKSDGSFLKLTSVLIRISDYADTPKESIAVKCGDALYTVKSGDTLVFPEITKYREGFVAEGWADGDTLYHPGEAVTINEAKLFYIRYKRTEIFSAMDMAK